VAERGGFMGIGLLPLVWLLRIADGLRRFGDRLGHSAQVAQVAIPEAVSSTVGTAAAPVVSSGVGERVVAAGMTLLLAGGVTVGAAKIVEDRNRNEAPARAVAEATVETPDTPKVRVARSHAADPAFDAGRTGDAGEIRAEPPIVGEPEPSPVAEPSPSVEPSPSPEVSPSPEPTVTPPTPAPKWTMSFASDLLGETSSVSLVSSKVQGKVGKAVRFSQTVTGSLDGPNDAVTRIYLEYWGSAEGKAGKAEFFALFLDTPAGRYEYQATASLASVALDQDGSAVYRFTGSFALTTAPAAAEASMPHDGSITLDLSFWADGTSLYRTGMQLVESTG